MGVGEMPDDRKTAFTTEALDMLRLPLDEDLVTKKVKDVVTIRILEYPDAINQADRIFGKNMWEAIIQDVKVMHGGYAMVVRVEVKAGDHVITRDGVSFREFGGSGIADHILALSECFHDAMKMSLQSFGDQFGLTLDDSAWND